MNLYQQQILDHYHHPRHGTKPVQYSHTLRLENLSCGDLITVYLNIAAGVIADIGFEAEGCAISIAAASMLSEQLLGKDLQHLKSLTSDDIISLLGIQLTPSRIKCATLALEAMQSAAK